VSHRAVTRVETATAVLGVIAIGAGIVFAVTYSEPHVAAQTYMKVRATGDLVYVLGRNQQVGSLSHPVWVCRIDHGPNTMPRYVETNFTENELVPAVQAEAPK
jgi:hypothetical protein